MSDKAKRPYPEDLIDPEELPDFAPEEHPTPWEEYEGGNGHFYLYDANNIKVAHVHCWDKKDLDLYEEKLKKINEKS